MSSSCSNHTISIATFLCRTICLSIIFFLVEKRSLVDANKVDSCLEGVIRNIKSCETTQNENSTDYCYLNADCSKLNLISDSNRLKSDFENEDCSLILLPPKNLDGSKNHTNNDRPTPFEVWLYGGISVGIISLSGVSGGLLWPILNSYFYKHIMRFLIGLAVGCLTATAVFQLLPEGFQLKETDPELTFMKSAFFAWFSIWFLFTIEASTKILFTSSSKKKMEKKKKKADLALSNNGGSTYLPQLPLKDEICKQVGKDFEMNSLILENQEVEVSNIPETPKLSKKSNSDGHVANVAWMIIFGDGLHNLIDGMSIGAGFSKNISTGLSISLAIACEEFPHELGDFAILLQSGLGLHRALLYNFLSACTAFIGLVIGIILGDLEGAHYIFSFAGGLFLYVSLTHLIPELQGMLDEGLEISRWHGLSIFILQNIGIVTGSTLLYIITKYSDSISICFKETFFKCNEG